MSENLVMYETMTCLVMERLCTTKIFNGILTSSILSEFIDPGFMSVRVSNKASKTIGPPGKPEGNTTHRMHLHSLTRDRFNGWL
jgi:hypothetical protein